MKKQPQQKMQSTTICFVAGKSGGHIIPCLTRAEQHKQQYPDDTIIFFSTTNVLDQSLLKNHPAIDHWIQLKIGRYSYQGMRGYFLLVYDFLSSCWQTFFIIKKMRPRRMISSGGVILLVPAFIAWLFSIPLELHELNVVPGKAITFFAPFAHKIVICFKQTAAYFHQLPCFYEPYPVRYAMQKVVIKKQQSKKSSKKTVLLLGGSQGSLFLNNLAKQWIISLPEENRKEMVLVHQIGHQDSFDYATFYAQHTMQATVFSYHDNLADWYQHADLVICRAGAGTLFELIYFDTAALLIPLETAYTNHQYENAHACTQEHPHLFTMIKQTSIEKDAATFFVQLNRMIFL